jgi:hypothetical protein
MVCVSLLIQCAGACIAYEDFSKRGKLLTKRLMLNGYNESRLVSQILRWPCLRLEIITGLCTEWFVSCSLLDCCFHAGFGGGWFRVPGFDWGARRVWPVSGGCLLLHDTWIYLCICWESVLPCTRFCVCTLDCDYVLHIINFPILYIKTNLILNSIRYEYYTSCQVYY